MKTSTSFKLRTITRALKAGMRPKVTIAGVAAEYAVADLRNLNHSVVLELDRHGGFLTVDPEDITTVWVKAQPSGEED